MYSDSALWSFFLASVLFCSLEHHDYLCWKCIDTQLETMWEGPLGDQASYCVACPQTSFVCADWPVSMEDKDATLSISTSFGNAEHFLGLLNFTMTFCVYSQLKMSISIEQVIVTCHLRSRLPIKAYGWLDIHLARIEELRCMCSRSHHVTESSMRAFFFSKLLLLFDA